MREEALRLLATCSDGRELPFLLLRLNDCVEPVQRLAQDIVVQRLKPEYGRHFMRHFYLILMLPEYRHRDLSSCKTPTALSAAPPSSWPSPPPWALPTRRWRPSCAGCSIERCAALTCWCG